MKVETLEAYNVPPDILEIWRYAGRARAAAGPGAGGQGVRPVRPRQPDRLLADLVGEDVHRRDGGGEGGAREHEGLLPGARRRRWRPRSSRSCAGGTSRPGSRWSCPRATAGSTTTRSSGATSRSRSSCSRSCRRCWSAKPQLMEVVGLVVVDELQMITDKDRGPTLELLLTKLRIATSKPRIIGLSAVLGRAQTLADWLGARLLVDTRRPVELRKGVLCRGEFRYLEHNSGAGGGRGRSPTSDHEKREELLLAAVEELVRRGEQVLAFVPDRAIDGAVRARRSPSGSPPGAATAGDRGAAPAGGDARPRGAARGAGQRDRVPQLGPLARGARHRRAPLPRRRDPGAVLDVDARRRDEPAGQERRPRRPALGVPAPVRPLVARGHLEVRVREHERPRRAGCRW